MLQLSLQSARGVDGTAEMFIACQSKCISFTVIDHGKQLDFSMEQEDWNQFKVFIDAAVKREQEKPNEENIDALDF